MNIKFKNFLGTANKGIGKLKGFIMKNLPSLDQSESTQSSQETNSENSSSSPQNQSTPQKNQPSPSPEKNPKKEEQKETSTIIKSSKDQFDFSVEDDDEEIKQKKVKMNLK